MLLFRASALKRLQSPTRLDELLQTTTSRNKWALAGLAALVGAALLWSIFGSVHIHVSSTGILIREEGIYNASAQGDGTVLKLLVRPGDPVTVGQVVGQIAQPQLEAQARGAKSEAERLRQDHDDQVQRYSADDKLYAATVAFERTNISQALEARQKRLAAIQADLKLARVALVEQRKQLQSLLSTLETQQESAHSVLTKATALRRSGSISEIELLRERNSLDEVVQRLKTGKVDLAKLAVSTQLAESEANKEIFQVEESIHDLQARQSKLDQTESERTTRRREELFEKLNRAQEAESKLHVLERQLEQITVVRSLINGRVIEIKADLGQAVHAGTPIIALEEPWRQLEVVLFTKAFEGKKIRPGMIVEVTPSTVKREEYGYILGKVQSVSDFPASEEGMLYLLPNKNLVKELAKEGAGFEVHAQLETDPDTPSGYRWSSGQGPPITLHSGTLCNCEVRIREQRPITLVLPVLRKSLGLD